MIQNPIADPVTMQLQSLMLRYQGAESAAGGELMERLTPQLYRFFASRMGRRNDAEDLLQDTWLRIHRARHSYRPGEPVLPWLYAIARRVRVDSYRRGCRTTAHEVALGMEHEGLADRRSPCGTAPSFDELVETLPASQREVLMLLKVRGLSVEEVACATSCSAGAVKLKAHRAYRHLRTMLAASPVLRT